MDQQRRKQLVEEYQQQPRKMGVYQIRNLTNHKIWIESSLNLYGAYNKDVFILNMGNHDCVALQLDWKVYGEQQFEMEILEQVKLEEGESLIGMIPLNVPINHPTNKKYKKELQKLEQKWLDKLQPYGDKGYNQES
ncbi:GIY-YIG nuclease family protein [Paenibacillus crassostreae]|uniref:LuxR family transcriptional regulator n=1 Tax=Paenibacillus crassostreae TaxID=1763538 RepID=A0A167GE39_9BACL|nr:GIY-YIG nuclease family protein [Paenibacillus crassostreae]AOZ92712.1 hypothetical protein LPB68_11110 [Paenibacillus crassostreae]OAB77484.1 hypothetical protein PNBC_02105 [Paenibacillus crassostreae]